MTRIGSWCSGIGGLELGLERALPGARTVWQSEPDPHASTVLAHRWGVPNFGDLRDADWAHAPQVDLLCAGFPCQPSSQAGQRRGVEDERWLWNDIVEALGRMDPRPGLLVFENVPGLRTVGGGEAFRQVIESLASLGYVGSWWTVRSVDVGAPHRRERIIIVASADPDCTGAGRDAGAVPRPPEAGGWAQFHLRAAVDGGAAPAYADHAGSSGEGSPESVWGDWAAAVQRWEALFRPAPEPRDERGRLNPEMPEWMMGFPAGWVTNPALGLSRTAQLRLIGNAVQPQVIEDLL